MNLYSTIYHREITPLTVEDCLLVFDRYKDYFDYPIHFHPEYEINFICNAEGVQRVVGDHVSDIGNLELVIVGPNQQHGWEQSKCTNKDIREITVQFHKNLFHDSLLKRNVMQPIREFLEQSHRGVAFSYETIKVVQPRIENLVNLTGMDSYMELLSLIYDLSISGSHQILSSTASKKQDFFNNDKLKFVCEFVQENYRRKIKVEEVAELLNMTGISFSRFIKNHTGKTFIEYLNDSRIGFASRYLIENNYSISEIAFICGFNNLANFNRIFKKQKRVSPREFRKNFAGIKRVN